MRRAIIPFMMIAALTTTSLNSYAADAAAINKTTITQSDFNNMKENVESAGFTFSQSPDKLDISIDQTKLFNMIPTLVKADAIANVTADDIKMAPMTVTVYAAGVTFAVTIMSGIYARDTKVDKLHVTTYVTPAGTTDKKECFSFDYSRAAFDKLDLDSTTTNDFITNTPSFTFSEWCKSTLDSEEKANTPAPEAAKPATTNDSAKN